MDSDSGPDVHNFTVDRNPVDQVDGFINLGNVETSDGCCRRRIGLATSTMSSRSTIYRILNTILSHYSSRLPIARPLNLIVRI